MFDWKKWLEQSGVVLDLVDAARNKIAEGINKELERRLSSCQEELGETIRLLDEARKKLNISDACLSEANAEISRLREQLSEVNRRLQAVLVKTKGKKKPQ